MNDKTLVFMWTLLLTVNSAIITIQTSFSAYNPQRTGDTIPTPSLTML